MALYIRTPSTAELANLSKDHRICGYVYSGSFSPLSAAAFTV